MEQRKNQKNKILRDDTAKQFRAIRRILNEHGRTPREQIIINAILWIAFLIFWIAAAVILTSMWTTPAHAEDQIDYDQRALRAIIGESENQCGYSQDPCQGMLAVACAIRNRGSLKGVYGEHAPRVVKHLYSNHSAIQAMDAWEESENPASCAFIQNANSWENTKAFGRPDWADSCQEIVTIKDHTFFRCPRKGGS